MSITLTAEPSGEDWWRAIDDAQATSVFNRTNVAGDLREVHGFEGATDMFVRASRECISTVLVQQGMTIDYAARIASQHYSEGFKN